MRNTVNGSVTLPGMAMPYLLANNAVWRLTEHINGITEILKLIEPLQTSFAFPHLLTLQQDGENSKPGRALYTSDLPDVSAVNNAIARIETLVHTVEKVTHDAPLPVVIDTGQMVQQFVDRQSSVTRQMDITETLLKQIKDAKDLVSAPANVPGWSSTPARYELATTVQQPADIATANLLQPVELLKSLPVILVPEMPLRHLREIPVVQSSHNTIAEATAWPQQLLGSGTFHGREATGQDKRAVKNQKAVSAFFMQSASGADDENIRTTNEAAHELPVDNFPTRSKTLANEKPAIHINQPLIGQLTIHTPGNSSIIPDLKASIEAALLEILENSC